MGLRVPFELNALQIHDLTLIPAEQWHDGREAWQRVARNCPGIEILLARHGADIADFSL